MSTWRGKLHEAKQKNLKHCLIDITDLLQLGCEASECFKEPANTDRRKKFDSISENATRYGEMETWISVEDLNWIEFEFDMEPVKKRGREELLRFVEEFWLTPKPIIPAFPADPRFVYSVLDDSTKPEMPPAPTPTCPEPEMSPIPTPHSPTPVPTTEAPMKIVEQRSDKEAMKKKQALALWTKMKPSFSRHKKRVRNYVPKLKKFVPKLTVIEEIEDEVPEPEQSKPQPPVCPEPKPRPGSKPVFKTPTGFSSRSNRNQQTTSSSTPKFPCQFRHKPKPIRHKTRKKKKKKETKEKDKVKDKDNDKKSGTGAVKSSWSRRKRHQPSPSGKRCPMINQQTTFRESDTTTVDEKKSMVNRGRGVKKKKEYKISHGVGVCD